MVKNSKPLYGMKNLERKQILTRIEKLISRTESRIEDLREMTQPIGPENAIGRVSRMDAINNKSVMEAALRAAESELDDLYFAQKHIDDQAFGICTKCKQPIDFKRLMLMPGSNKCIRCAR